jgi:hypothetical protein
MSPQLIKQVLQGFTDYKAKHGAKSIIRETSPRQGYHIDGQFYSDESILKPFRAAYEKVKESKKIA